MSKRPAFWILFALLSLISIWFAVSNFPRAFPIVSLNLRMDRAAALRGARMLANERHWGPNGDFRQAATFGVDDTVQTFVELEGGGKEAFRGMLAKGLYAAYQWQVRNFREGETEETLVRFTPDGTPYGFVEKLRENAPGASLAEADARRIAEDEATRGWRVDLADYDPVEASTEVKPGGRTDHTFVYERPDEKLGEGRYRLRLVVSGDRLTELTYFVRTPEAFARRFEEMRSANNAIAFGAFAAAIVLYLLGGGGLGIFTLLRQGWILWREPLLWGTAIALLQALSVLNAWPLAWMGYDTALPGNTFLLQRLGAVIGTFLIGVFYLTVTFMAAESLSRRAFPHHPQLWRLFSRDAAGTTPVLGRALGGYLYTGIEFAYIVGFYLIASRYFGWWTPSEALVEPDILATHLPWLSAVAPSLHAGLWEESLFRAVPIAGAALIGDRFGGRRGWIVAALVLQAVIFGGGHANYPSMPAYSRLIELIVPAFVWGLIYLEFGLLPTILTHYAFDLSLFSIPLFTASSAGAHVDQTLVILCGLAPLGIVLLARLRARGGATLPESLLNRGWSPQPAAAPAAAVEAVPAPAGSLSPARTRIVLALGLAGLIVWVTVGFQVEAPRLRVGRGAAKAAALQALAAQGFTPGPRWIVSAHVEAPNDIEGQFVWRTAGPEVYRRLLGSYVPAPGWEVRAASFTGDIVERAEEWQVQVGPEGKVTRVRHQLPQRRAGPALDEVSAREVAHTAVRERFGLDPAVLREVSANSSQLPARRDWTFTFADTVGHRLATGECRVAVEIAGDQVVDADLFVFVPEDWARRYRGDESLLSLASGAGRVMVVVALLAGMIFAIVAWSRRRYPGGLAGRTFGVLAAAGLLQLANRWPAITSAFSTAQPLELQTGIAAVAGSIGQLVIAAASALVAGLGIARARAVSQGAPRAPVAVGIAAGLAFAAIVRLLGVLSRGGIPPWLDYGAASHAVPAARDTLAQIASVTTRSALLLLTFATAHHLSAGWTRRRAMVGLLLFLFAGVGFPLAPAADTMQWLLQSAATGAVIVLAYALVLRYDVTLVPAAVGTLAALSMLRTAILQPWPGAVAGGAVAMVVGAAVSMVWLRAARASEL